MNTVLTGHAVQVRARLTDDSLDLAQLRLHYRWGARGPYLRKTMRSDGRGAFVGCVPGARAATGLQYYLEAVDIRGSGQAVFGTSRRPVVVRSALAPSAPFPRPAQTCPDGPGQRASAAPPTRARLRRVRLRLRRRALALEARSRRLRNAGRTLVHGSLVALAVGAGPWAATPPKAKRSGPGASASEDTLPGVGSPASPTPQRMRRIWRARCT